MRLFDNPEEVVQRLQQGPGTESMPWADSRADPSPAPRWTLDRIRDTFDFLADYSLSGVWRWLRDRVGVKLRGAKVQQYSPDPQYLSKLDRLLECLAKVHKNPFEHVVLFLDEVGFSRWPEPAADWCLEPPAAPPLADRQQSNNGLWRLIGAMNACSGRVTYLDGYVVGRAKVLQMYERLHRQYRRARKIYVVQDNWSIHTHEDVLGGLQQWPRIEPVWLPTYAPWLNPIEKLWRWLKTDVLRLHRQAHSFERLKQTVFDFLDQFTQGSNRLLEYVGLSGDGRLAKALRGE